jgi:hypothetical protein
MTDIRPAFNPHSGNGLQCQPASAANAALIAAAPDLLAALRELVAESENDFHHPNTGGFEIARAAIAKAEGKQ